MGDSAGESIKLGVAVATGLGMGNANAGEGEVEIPADILGEEDAVPLGDARGLYTGLGVGEGGMIFSQRCNGTLAPPISLTSVSQRA